MEGFEEFGEKGREGGVGVGEKEDGVFAVFEAEGEGGLIEFGGFCLAYNVLVK